MKRLLKDIRLLPVCITICSLVMVFVFSGVAVTSAKAEEEYLPPKMIYKVREDLSKANSVSKKSGYFKLDATPILQYPELPTGCEVTSLATVLNFYDCDVDKTYLAEYYLEQGEIGDTNPFNAFVGSPFSENAYGCYSDVIKNTALGYINDYGLDLNVKNISKLDLPQLLKYVENGQPVIFWATMNLAKPYESTVWQIDGSTVVWYAYEHCMVLLGFDYDTDCYIVSDPLKGIIEYKRELVEVRYNQIGKQAVLVAEGRS